MDLCISIIALVVSIISLILTGIIYERQKKDAIVESFYDDLCWLFCYSSTGGNVDARRIMIKLKLKAGFLNEDLFYKFKSILPILTNLNLTVSNPNRDRDWDLIQDFIYCFTKAYHPGTKLTKQYIKDNL